MLHRTVESFLSAGIPLKLVAGQEDRLPAEFNQAFGHLASQHIDQHGPCNCWEVGPVRHSNPAMSTTQSPGGH